VFDAQNGSVVPVHSHAPGFTLTDQYGKVYSLGEHADRLTILTFLDPVCWTDCPLLAAQLAQVRATISPNAKVDIVAVAADPYHEKISDLQHFIALHGLQKVKNFYFVTGKLASVKKVWTSYGIGVTMKPTDRMSVHSDFIFLIAPGRKLRWIIPDDPLGTWALQRSAESEILSLLSKMGIH